MVGKEEVGGEEERRDLSSARVVKDEWWWGVGLVVKVREGLSPETGT